MNTATYYGLTDTDVESNQAWWLAMPQRLASRRQPRFAPGGIIATPPGVKAPSIALDPHECVLARRDGALVCIRGHVHSSTRRWRDLGYDEQRAVLGLPEVAS